MGGIYMIVNLTGFITKRRNTTHKSAQVTLSAGRSN